MERFSLREKAHERMAEFGVTTPWQAYIQVRLQYYSEMLADPQVIRDNQWPHNIALLNQAHQAKCKVGLATMSYCKQVQRVLYILNLSETFDFVASRDDVEHGKPDPAIYLLVAKELGVTPAECLVFEDSPAGVKAALNAKMNVIAVSTPFTQKRLHESNLLPTSHIVDEPQLLLEVVAHLVELK